ncbi:MAG: hypothetical protein IKU54_02350 [Oscillospiraceae bacterium]|nr:hypothetical protein [Oscillospiraceae bacterium]
MENRYHTIFFLAASYTLFSFATYISDDKINLHGWLISIFLSGVVNILASMIIFGNKKAYKTVYFVGTIYLYLVFFKTVNSMNSYMQMYYSRHSVIITVIVTLLMLILLKGMTQLSLERLALPVAYIGLFMIMLIFLLNCNKVNPINLYSSDTAVYASEINVTLFDYIIPLALMTDYNTKKDRIFFIKLNTFIVFIISILTILVFSCLKGDIMYSISPLQIAFQLPVGLQIFNFEAIYSCFLWFCYFSGLILLTISHNNVLLNGVKSLKSSLLALILAVWIQSFMSEKLWGVMNLLIVILLYFTVKRKDLYAKN